MEPDPFHDLDLHIWSPLPPKPWGHRKRISCPSNGCSQSWNTDTRMAMHASPTLDGDWSPARFYAGRCVKKPRDQHGASSWSINFSRILNGKDSGSQHVGPLTTSAGITYPPSEMLNPRASHRPSEWGSLGPGANKPCLQGPKWFWSMTTFGNSVPLKQTRGYRRVDQAACTGP